MKIYGERNTGTNYVTALLAQNLDVSVLPGVVPRNIERIAARANRLVATRTTFNGLRPGERVKDAWFTSSFHTNLGWKHMLVSADHLNRYGIAKRATFVTLTKNPYAWLLSMFKRPYHSGFDSPKLLMPFLSSPWRTVGRERASRYYASPMALWNAKTDAYSTLGSEFATANLRYEDLLRDPFGAIDAVRSISGATSMSYSYTNVLDSTKGERDKGFSFYREYYLDELWRADLDADAVELINNALDRDLVGALGYEILDPKNFLPDSSS